MEGVDSNQVKLIKDDGIFYIGQPVIVRNQFLAYIVSYKEDDHGEIKYVKVHDKKEKTCEYYALEDIKKPVMVMLNEKKALKTLLDKIVHQEPEEFAKIFAQVMGGECSHDGNMYHFAVDPERYTGGIITE